MSTPRLSLLALAAAAGLLGACSFANEALWPVLSGSDPHAAPLASAAPPAADASAAATAATAAGGGGTGRIAELRRSLAQLADDIAQHRRALGEARQQMDAAAAAADATAAGIETRLASRSVPNDPQLLGDWNQAQGQVNRTGAELARLTNVSNWATSDAALASYIQQATRAAVSQGDLTAPDRRRLDDIAHAADQASQAVDGLITEVSGEIASRNLFIAAAHRRLAALAPAIARGGQGAALAAASRPGAAAGRRALVTIRFDRADIAFEEDLRGALNAALDRRPDAHFDIVAVTPPGRPGGAAAAGNIERVVGSLSAMGLPPDRMRLSAATTADAAGNEVRIYVR